MSTKYTSISEETFKTLLSRYASLVPSTLSELDTVRYENIPNNLCRQDDGKEAPHLTREEVEQLVEWKLKHGTFRPKLLQLVQSNNVEIVETTTRKAFAVDGKDALAALKILTALKGIGPTTASLLLSVHRMEEIPFFSDELFRWLMWDDPAAPGGWKRGIKYNSKEYEEILTRVMTLRERLGVRADQCEKVAWVLGKEGVSLDDADSEVKMGDSAKSKTEDIQQQQVNKVEEQEMKRELPKKPSTKQTKTTITGEGMKRKNADDRAAPEGIRRSTRSRTMLLAFEH